MKKSIDGIRVHPGPQLVRQEEMDVVGGRTEYRIGATNQTSVDQSSKKANLLQSFQPSSIAANSQDSTHLEQSEQSVHSPTQFVESLEPLSNAPIIETFKPKLQIGSILDTAGLLTFINDKELGKKVLKCLEDGGLLKYATFDYKQHHLDYATEFYINSRISNTKDAILSTVNGAKELYLNPNLLLAGTIMPPSDTPCRRHHNAGDDPHVTTGR
nr:uncharacterized protein LOC109167327 [Ipomoea trifida]